jgi:hypothetical protein
MWKCVSGGFDRNSTSGNETGVRLAKLQELAAQIPNVHSKLHRDCVDREEQRLHGVRAEYSARFPIPDAFDLKRADPCLVGGGCIHHGSANSYGHVLCGAFTRLKRQAALGDHVTKFEVWRHGSPIDFARLENSCCVHKTEILFALTKSPVYARSR